ncbi:NUDIX hydrolase [Halobacterium yunchengense]|uniref:NUDIX hydrolase n=1 Tax=Halobacterium yunchengense TaxID=3108497 RepID=UPI0030096430
MIPEFCPRCGTELGERRVDGRRRKWCPACERPEFRNPVPVAGVSVVDGTGRVLLVRRGVEPWRGEWSTPAGHLEVEEEPRVAAARELREETGLAVDPADLVLLEVTQLEPVGEKHALSVGYAAAAADATGTPVAGSDAAAVEWVDREAVEERAVRPHVPRRVDAAVAALLD